MQQRSWVQHRFGDARRRSAVNVARLALSATDILPEHRNWLHERVGSEGAARCGGGDWWRDPWPPIVAAGTRAWPTGVRRGGTQS
jgi:hypothetical protein